jgi:AcrR family transcriptional regulator
MTPRKYDSSRRAEAVQETRDRILQATFDLHNEKGVRATSMQDIAERADVALRTVYNHFPTVDDLVQGCGAKVNQVLSPPTGRIFEGLTGFEARVRRLVDELFAMYERGQLQIGVARCEQHDVPVLGAFVAESKAAHEALVREALRPSRPGARTVREVIALTDFYVWKACRQHGLTTRQAADMACCAVEAIAGPRTSGTRAWPRT